MLSLRYIPTGAAGATTLGEGLACISTLTNLDLGFNQMGTEGAVKLAEGLASKRALRQGGGGEEGSVQFKTCRVKPTRCRVAWPAHGPLLDGGDSASARRRREDV